MGSTFTDSANHELTIFGKKEKKFSQDPKSKHLNLPHIQQLFTHHLHCIYNYLHIIYIVLSIITNLKVIWSIWEDKPRFYANTTPFLYKRLEHPWVLYWNQSPTHTEGWDCIPSYFGFQKKKLLLVSLCPMQYVEHTDAKRWIVVYLKFKCNWESYILSGNTTLGILPG